jgi:hypothetical protein
MRVRRDISSIPVRSASETWNEIVNLVTGPRSIDGEHLRQASGIMGSIITDEHPADQAIVLKGVGPQLRLYCRYGIRALEEGDGIDALTWNPTAGDWSMHVPCDAENISWAEQALAQISDRIKVFDVAKGDLNTETERTSARALGIEVDWDPKG